jgi:hypothetical protein
MAGSIMIAAGAAAVWCSESCVCCWGLQAAVHKRYWLAAQHKFVHGEL